MNTVIQAFYLTSFSSLSGYSVYSAIERPIAGILEFMTVILLRHLLPLSLTSPLLPIKTIPELPGKHWWQFACENRPQRWQMELLLVVISKYLLQNTETLSDIPKPYNKLA